MKIAYIGIKGLPSKGGAERVVEAIVQRLAKRHVITVYCSRHYTPSNINIQGVRLFRVPCLSGKYTHMLSFNLLAALHALIFGRYDLIHLHNIEASFVLPILKLRYPVIATAHGRITHENKWGKIATMIIQSIEVPFGVLSDAATSVSSMHSQELSARFHRTISYIPNGVDNDVRIDLEAARCLLETKGLIEQEYILFVAARIIPLKGAHLLLEAFRKIKGNYRLVIVGDLSQSPKYARRLRSLADERTIFFPFVNSSSKLLGLLKLSHMFVFSSTNEGMSMVLLEVASVGVPILCTDIPANTAVLSNRALYFRLGDVTDLSEKLQWALDHPYDMEKLGQQARAWVKKQFSWDMIAEYYDEIYRKLQRTALF